MKNKMLGSAVLAIALLAGSVSCSKEIDKGFDSLNGNQALQFSIKNGKGALVTYAIAEGDQWTINTIDVYAFSGGTLVGTGKMTEGTDYSIVTSSGTSTITATPAWLSGVTGQTVSFYFVANDVSSTSGAHIPTTVPTSEAAFKELLTNQLAGPDGEGKYGLITPVLLFSDVVADVPLTGKVQKEVELIRRDARFDIYNNMSSSIVVNKIYVSNANIQGHIFGVATGTNVPATGSHEAITGPTTYDATTFLATSVFHLYPTLLGKVTDGKTEIVIEATVGGVAQNFVLKGEMDIVANHRYILKLDPVSLTFSVTVADYEEGNGGNPIETELGGDDVIALESFVASTPAAWDDATRVYTFDATTGETLDFTATTKYGTKAVVEYVAGGVPATDIVVNKSTAVSYSGYTTTDNYTIDVPASASDGFYIRVTIKSNGGAAKETIIFQKGNIDLSELFPDPALRQIISDMFPSGVTAADLLTIAALDLSARTDIASLKGIEYLPNLVELNAKGNLNIDEIDLSGNIDLTILNVMNTSITELDLSNNPKIEDLRISYTNIATLDISKCPKIKMFAMSGLTWDNIDCLIDNMPALEEMHAGLLNNITSMNFSSFSNLKKAVLQDNNNLAVVNFSGNNKLESVSIKNSKISTLDLSNSPNLKILGVYHSDLSTGQSFLTQIDIRNSENLTDLYVINNPIMTTIYVWDTFESKTPIQWFTAQYKTTGSPLLQFIIP